MVARGVAQPEKRPPPQWLRLILQFAILIGNVIALDGGGGGGSARRSRR